MADSTRGRGGKQVYHERAHDFQPVGANLRWTEFMGLAGAEGAEEVRRHLEGFLASPECLESLRLP
ncbi:MAG: hypothetical protein ACE5JJ_08210, partial [Nitrospinota bacterium]